MAKQFIKFNLAAKVRILFGSAFVLIIAAALLIPWLYMRAMVNEEARRAGGEITRVYLNEFIETHHQPAEQRQSSQVTRWYVTEDPTDLRRGPMIFWLGPDETLEDQADPWAQRALETFQAETDQTLVQVVDTDEQDRRIFHTYRAIRVTQSCLTCHREAPDPERRFRTGQIKGLIRVDLPGQPGRQRETVITFLMVTAGGLSLLLAGLVFYFITTRLILRPVHRLRTMADKAAEGDLSVRSELATGDEFEQLGGSFNDMLGAITETQNQLRTANRALDLKLNELAESNVALFESNRVKSEFLANVSHELRTPLNSIIGFAELIGEHDDPRIARYGSNIQASARMLLRIINDLLDLARIEAGKVRLTVTGASVADICETLHGLVTPLANKKQLQLDLTVEPDLPIIRTDAGKVQQILYNLLSNAIKFTPAGGRVTLSASRADNGDGVVLSVADTGPGISETDQQRIFEKFQQLDSTHTREHGGAGLGLAIARELSELLGGSIDLESEPGKGTTFIVILPLEMPAPEEPTANGNGDAKANPRSQ